MQKAAAADPGDCQSDVETAEAAVARQDAPPEKTAADKIANLATRALSHWLAKLGALAGTLLVLLSVYNTITGDLKAHTESQISGLEARIDDRISGLEARIDDRISSLEAHTESRISGLDGRISGLEARIDGRISSLAQLMDTRFEAVNERLDRQDASIARLSDDVRAVRADISSLSERVAAVEAIILQDH